MNTSPPRASAWWSGQLWFVVGLLALFAAVSVQYSFKALHNRSAFDRWRDMVVHGVECGEDMAGLHGYPNPPIMALVLYPLAKMPPVWGALTWFYVKVGLTLLALRWVFELVETAGRPFPLWARAVTVLLSLGPIIGDLHHGNVNLFILFLIVAALTAFRRRHGVLCGLILGLAVACKITPALFFPYFLWKRQWRVLAGGAAGLVLFLWPGFVPALALGWQENQRQVASWYVEMVRPFVVEGKVTSEHNNQSLPGLVTRLATHSASFSIYVKDPQTHQDVYTPTEYDNVVDLPPALARWLVKGGMALFALAVMWRCRTPTASRGRQPLEEGWRLSAEFGVVLIGMLLFSERTWKHHCVTLVLPFAVLCYYLATERPARWLRWGVIGALGAAALLMLSTSSGVFADDSTKTDVTGVFGKQMEVYGAYLWAWLLLAAALMAVLGRAPDRTVSADRRQAGCARPWPVRTAAAAGSAGVRAAG
jgi:alpha-1,2-mannosyltransferase